MHSHKSLHNRVERFLNSLWLFENLKFIYIKYTKYKFCKMYKILYTSINSSGNSKICQGQSRGEREDMRKVKAYLLSCCCCWSLCSQIIQQELIPMKKCSWQPSAWISLRRGHFSGLVTIPILNFILMVSPLHPFLNQKNPLTKEYVFNLDFPRFSAGYIFLMDLG